jgi:F-type H+-transporting ATPase subunit a
MEHSDNPLHPFELHELVPLHLFGLDISLNKAVLMMWAVIALVTGLFFAAAASRRLVPTRLQSLAEILVDFIRGMILDTIGKQGLRFFPFVATLFLFILFCNLLGLIPGTYTVTSQIVVTAAFAIFVYSMSIVLGFALHGIKFLGILVPAGTPGWLLPLMMPIELISQLARPLSLAVRLFANMTAGHTVLAVLFGMVLSLPLIAVPVAAKAGLFIVLIGLIIGWRWIVGVARVWGLVALCVLIPVIASLVWVRWLPFVVTIGINGLEVFIAFIQAYIFTILTCVYLGDAVTLHGHADAHAH